MKSGKTLQQLATEVKRQAESIQDYRVDTRNVSMLDDARLGLGIIPTPALHVNDLAHSQIAARLEIPQKYYDLMRSQEPSLLAENVNRWFHKKADKRMVRTMDNRVRAFLSSSYRPLDNFKLVEAVLPKLHKLNATIESSEITERHLYIKAVFHQIEGKVAVGDVVKMGLVVSNSEVGCGSLKVEPLIYRMVCSNGMIVADGGIRKYHVGRRTEEDNAQEFFKAQTRIADDRAFWMKVKDTIDATVNQGHFQTILWQLQRAKNQPVTIENPIKAVEAIANKYRMTDQEQEGVINHLIKGGDMSTYGIVQAITRASQDRLDYERATEFERIGGEYLAANLN